MALPRVPTLQLGSLIKNLNLFSGAVKKSAKDMKIVGQVLNRAFAQKRGGYIKKMGGGAYHPTKKAIYGPKHPKAGQKTNLPATISNTIFKSFPKDPGIMSSIKESWIGKMFGGVGKVATAPLKVVGKGAKGLSSPFSKGFNLSGAMIGKAGRKQGAKSIIKDTGIKGTFKRVAFKQGAKLGQGLSSLTKLKPAQLKAAGSAFKGLAMGAVGAAATGAILMVAMKLLSAMQPFKPIMDALVLIFTIFGQIMSVAFMPIIERLYDVMLNDHVMDMFDRLGILFYRLIEPILPLVDSLFPLLFSVLNATISVLEVLMPWIQLLFLMLNLLIIPISIIILLLEGFSSGLQILSGVTQSIVSEIVSFSNNLWDTFNNLIDSIIGLFDGLVDYVLDQFYTITGGFRTFFVGIKNFINEILIGNINSVIADVNSTLGSSIPTIPMLGTGGIVTSPMLAVVGDRPEAIVPLDQYNGGGSGQVTINIYVENVADDSMIEKLANRIREEVERQKYWSQ